MENVPVTINPPSTDEHTGEFIVQFDNYAIINCQKCGFKHVTPIPSQDKLNHLYQKEYYKSEKPFYIERYIEDIEWWNSLYTQRYKYFEKRILKKEKSILDIGSGPGLFLNLGKERGWATTGIEPSEQASKYSTEILGLDIKKFFLTRDTVDELGSFDVVNMGEVLEHLPDPAEMLGFVSKLLNDDGLLCLIVPNDFNPFQIALQNYHKFEPWWIAYPFHLNYFSPNTLSDLVARCGFEVLDVHTTFPIDMFLLMGRNYIGNDALGREIHAMRKNFEINMLNAGDDEATLLNKIYTSLSDLNIGREIVLYARKINAA